MKTLLIIVLIGLYFYQPIEAKTQWDDIMKKVVDDIDMRKIHLREPGKKTINLENAAKTPNTTFNEANIVEEKEESDALQELLQDPLKTRNLDEKEAVLREPGKKTTNPENTAKTPNTTFNEANKVEEKNEDEDEIDLENLQTQNPEKEESDALQELLQNPLKTQNIDEKEELEAVHPEQNQKINKEATKIPQGIRQETTVHKVNTGDENSKVYDKNILNEASRSALEILCVKAVNIDLKGFDVYDDCIIERGGFGYCFNHIGKEKLCKANVGKWEIEQVEYLPESNCGTWITRTSNGCKIVLAAGYYSEHEKAFYAKSAFKYLFWKGEKASTITRQLSNSKKDFALKQKYVTTIYFHDDL